MLPSTSPRAILYLPSPRPSHQPAPKIASTQSSESNSDEWIRVDESYRGAKIYLDPDVRQQLRRPSGHLHLTIPVCEDADRLGSQGLAAVHKVQLNVFSALAHAVLPRASGPKMRLYFEHIGRGEQAALTHYTGLTTEELIHFREYFGRLPEYWRNQSLNRPELLAVALHLLGGGAQPGPNLQTSASTKDEMFAAASHWLSKDAAASAKYCHELAALGSRQLQRLESGAQTAKKALSSFEFGVALTLEQRKKLVDLRARCAELDCYICLIKTILVVFDDPYVQVMLAPAPPLLGQAGQWLSGMAAYGARAVGDRVLRALQPEGAAPQP